jgi:hypothetical protein
LVVLRVVQPIKLSDSGWVKPVSQSWAVLLSAVRQVQLRVKVSSGVPVKVPSEEQLVISPVV